jgi:hypothetical protein
MEKEIIDFAQWYSGMDRAKVERAYQRYLRETKSTKGINDSQVDEDEYDDDEDEFECCDECDLPDACMDFGCAIRNGIIIPIS